MTFTKSPRIPVLKHTKNDTWDTKLVHFEVSFEKEGLFTANKWKSRWKGKKYLTFEIEEEVGLLFKIGACQNFKEIPHDNVPKGKKKDRVKPHILNRNHKSDGQIQVGQHLTALLWFYHGTNLPWYQSRNHRPSNHQSTLLPFTPQLPLSRRSGFPVQGLGSTRCHYFNPPPSAHTQSYGNPCALVASANRACHAYCSRSVPSIEGPQAFKVKI